MPIQYYMRAYNTNLSQYVDWIVDDQPDSTGLYSGYNTSQLINIAVNRVVQSKIDNFLKPLNSSDGYYFHLNSYDWLNAFPPSPNNPGTPLPVPSKLVGLAVVRGTTASSITPSTNIRDFATMTWVEGPTQTDGYWKFAFNTNGNHLSFSGSNIPVVVGSLISDGYLALGTNPAQSGIIRIPNNQWIEARRTSGTTDGYLIKLDTLDRVVLGSPADTPLVYIPGNEQVDGYIRDGAAATATTGFIRTGNNTSFWAFRDSTNANNLIALSSNSSNNLIIGNASATFGNVIYNTGTNLVHQFQTNSAALVEIGTSASAPNNFIRFVTGTVAPTIFQVDNSTPASTGQTLKLQSQNAVSTGSTGGILQLNSGSGTTAHGTVQIKTGTDATAKITVYPTVASTSTDNNSILFSESKIRIDNAQVNPRYMQDDTSALSGNIFTIQAQNTTGAGSTGGSLALTSGTGSIAHGNVELQTGGTTKIKIFPTSGASGDSNTILMSGNILRFDNAQSNPRLIQDNIATVSAIGQNFILQSQNAVGATSIGGDLTLSSGTGTTRDGYVRIRIGNSNKITITPTTTIIDTDVIINGTTSTINSTVVDLADRVIHVNSSFGTVPTPTQITGFSVDRGSADGINKRNYHGLFWVESDGYWKYAVNTDGYTSENTLTNTLPVIASTFLSQPVATTTLNDIPSVGGFRSLNNTTALSSRNAGSSADLLLVGTDSSNKLLWGAGTNNAGSVFNTSTGTIFDFQVASVSQVQITTSNINFDTSVSSPVISQNVTGGAVGQNLTLKAQDAGGTGGNLDLTSGAAPTAGNVNLKSGGTNKLIISPSSITSLVSPFTFENSVTNPVIQQNAAGAAIDGYELSVRAQNAGSGGSLGGNLILTSGSGSTRDGYVIIKNNNTIKATFAATQFTLAVKTKAFDGNIQNPVITQLDGNSTLDGYSLTIKSQSSTAPSHLGGDLIIASGDGYSGDGSFRDGYVKMFAGSVEQARVIPNKFVTLTGQRTKLTHINSGTDGYIQTNDYIIMVDTTAARQIHLPTNPIEGDTYQVKDKTGTANANNITINGSGKNIDGSSTYLINVNYATVKLVYNDTQWSVL